MGPSQIRTLKATLEVQISSRALAKKDFDKLQRITDANWRLPDSMSFQIQQVLLHEVYENLTKLETYSQLSAAFLAVASDLRNHNPDDYDNLLHRIQDLFFQEYDPGQLTHLVYLADRFPDLVQGLDSLLAAATEKQLYLNVLEAYLEKWPNKYLPKTLENLLDCYLQYGDPEDIKAFYQKYPACPSADSLPLYLQQLNRLQEDPNGYVFWHNRLASAYFVYQLAAKSGMLPEKHPFNAPLHDYYSELETLRTQKDQQALPLPLSQNINTKAREYAPLRSADGRLLYFCRRINGQEDIYVSRLENGLWTPALPINAINDPNSNDAPLSISADGSFLLLFQDGIVKWAERGKSGWNAPKPLFPEANRSRWQGISTISTDKRVILFSARRQEAMGLEEKEHPDIFFAERLPDGSWSAPQSVGPVINTPFTERSPFLHPDLRTLYFSSEGHGGMGGLDVFKTTRIGEGWTEWTKPVNLGPAINGTDNDWGYKVTTDGQLAYFASGSKQSDEDILEIALPENFRPQKVIQVSAYLESERKNLSSGTVIIREDSTGKVADIIQADPATGYFFTALPAGKKYSALILADQSLPIQLMIDKEFPENKKISLSLLEESSLFTLPDLYFDTDSHEIRPESFELLDLVATWIQHNQLKIEIRGHTDDTGGEAYNLQLSEKRAAAVKARLVDAGCISEDLTIKGFGHSLPLVNNQSAEARAKNRRVEIRIIEKGNTKTK